MVSRSRPHLQAYAATRVGSQPPLAKTAPRSPRSPPALAPASVSTPRALRFRRADTHPSAPPAHSAAAPASRLSPLTPALRRDVAPPQASPPSAALRRQQLRQSRF